MHFNISVEVDAGEHDLGPHRYISKYHAWICDYEEDEEGEECESEFAVGQMTFTLVDVDSALLDQQPIYDIFDTDGELMDYYFALYRQLDGITTFKRRVERFIRWSRNLLILNTLEIQPKFRGRNYGLLATLEIVQHFRSSVGLIAMTPAPLQIVESVPRKGSQVEGSSKEELRLRNRAIAKLKKYYAGGGFHSLSGTALMVRDPNEPLPFAEILQEDQGYEADPECHRNA